MGYMLTPKGRTESLSAPAANVSPTEGPTTYEKVWPGTVSVS